MRYALIDEGGLVVNVVVWDGLTPWTPLPGCSLIVSDEAGIGWTYDEVTGIFSAPPVSEGSGA